MPSLIQAFQLPFMTRALMIMLVIALVAGFIGVLVNLRRLEFISDGLTHAVFPGLAFGLLIAGAPGLLPGAALAAVIAAGFLTWFSRSGTGSDAAIAIVLTATFSIGVIVVSLGHEQADYAGELEALLFGSLLTIHPNQVIPLMVVCLAALAMVLLIIRPLLYRAFDLVAARAAGYPILLLDLMLNVAVALLVVATARAIGTLLVLAVLIVPGAVARLVTRRLALLFPTAIGFAALASGMGLYIAYAGSDLLGVDIPAGATVALMFALGYAVVLLSRARAS